MYNMQTAPYNANLSFFMDEFIIYVIIQHTNSLSMCFLFWIWKYVGFYDSRSDPIIYNPTYLQWFYVGSQFCNHPLLLHANNKSGQVDKHGIISRQAVDDKESNILSDLLRIISNCHGKCNCPNGVHFHPTSGALLGTSHSFLILICWNVG